MPRLQILILMMALATPTAFAACRIRAVGKIRFEGEQPYLIAFAGSLGEMRLKIVPASGINRAELLLHLLSVRGRTVAATGTCSRPPIDRQGEIATDLSLVRLTVPDAFRPNNGDEVDVDPR